MHWMALWAAESPAQPLTGLDRSGPVEHGLLLPAAHHQPTTVCGLDCFHRTLHNTVSDVKQMKMTMDWEEKSAPTMGRSEPQRLSVMYMRHRTDCTEGVRQTQCLPAKGCGTKPPAGTGNVCRHCWQLTPLWRPFCWQAALSESGKALDLPYFILTVGAGETEGSGLH